MNLHSLSVSEQAFTIPVLDDVTCHYERGTLSKENDHLWPYL